MNKNSLACVIALGIAALTPCRGASAPAGWAAGGSVLSPIPGAVFASDGRGGLFGAIGSTDFTDLGGHLCRLSAAGDSVRGFPSAGVELVPGNTLFEHETLKPISALQDGAGGCFVLVAAQVPWNGHGNFLDPVQLYVHRRTATGAVAPGWAREGVLLRAALLDHRYQVLRPPVMTADGMGGVLIAWSDGYPGRPNPRTIAQRVGADGSRKWGDEGAIVQGTDGAASLPTIIEDHTGGALVFWAQWDSSATQMRIRGQRLSASGGMRWGTGGRDVSRGAFDRIAESRLQLEILLTGALGAAIRALPDGEGGALLCWAGSRGADLEICATRVARDGALPWGREQWLCEAPGEQQSVVMTPAPNGAIVAWRDGRPGTDAGIYAQAVTRNGRSRWGASGALVSRGPGERQELTLHGDERGGAYLAWIESQAGYALFAQRLLPSGRPAHRWPENGVLVSRSTVVPNGYYTPLAGLELVEGGRGSAIAGWSSALHGSLAMRLTPDGPASAQAAAQMNVVSAPAALPVAATPTLRFALHGIAPNPVAEFGRVSFTLAEPGRAKLELLDVAGRRLWSRELGELGAGEHSVMLGDGGRLPRGVCFVRLSQGTRVATARVTVLR